MAIPAILSLLPTLAQFGLGAYQLAQGRKMAKEETPEFQIPKEYQSMLNLQQASMFGDMGGLSRVEQNIRGNTADTISTAARYGMIDPNTIGAAYGQESDALANLGVQNAMYKAGEKDKFLNVLDLMGQQKLAKQEWDVLAPFQRRMATASGAIGSGIQNMYGGLSAATDFFGTRSMMESMGYTPNSLFGNLFGNKAANAEVAALRNSLQVNPLTQGGQQTAYSLFQGMNPSLFGNLFKSKGAAYDVPNYNWKV